MINIRTRPDIALLVLRLAAGLSFFMHGYQKVFGMGVGAVTQGFTQMGIPLPGVAGPFISFLELLGGIALMLGLFTRVFGFLLTCDMLTATLLVHLKNGYLGEGGMELTFLLGAMALTLVLAGAGPFSLDAVLARRRAPST
jgi:putative oxidoreductase